MHDRCFMMVPGNEEPLRRLEFADSSGVVRLVVGELGGGPDNADRFGISLRGADGVERALLSIDEHGPMLVFVRHGNIALQLGVDDPALGGDHDGAFVSLADADGTPLLYVSAANDGSLVFSRQDPPPPTE